MYIYMYLKYTRTNIVQRLQFEIIFYTQPAVINGIAALK